MVMAVEERLQDAFVPNSRTLIFLPLAHVLARILEVACFYKRVAVAHEPDTTKVVERLSEIRPTFLVSVPRVLEKVYNSAAAKAETAGGAKAKIFKAAVQTAIDYSTALENGGTPSSACRSSRNCSPSSSIPSCTRPWAASATASSPAADRSAPASATSTGVRASTSSRATASPSRRESSPSIRSTRPRSAPSAHRSPV